MKNLRYLFVIVLIVLMCGFSWLAYKKSLNTNSINQAEAINIAAEKLKEFSKKNKILSSDFENAEIRWNGAQWEIYYKGVGKNDFLVNILVSTTGKAEVHSTKL